MEILKIIGIGLAAAALSVILRPHRPEFSMFIAIACGAFCLYFCMDMVKDAIAAINKIVDKGSIQLPYLDVLLKAIAIAYLTQFGADVCIDAGENAIASKVQFVGKILILFISLPLFISVFDMIVSVIAP